MHISRITNDVVKDLGFWSYLNDNNFGEKQTQLFSLLSYSYEVIIEAHIL